MNLFNWLSICYLVDHVLEIFSCRRVPVLHCLRFSFDHWLDNVLLLFSLWHNNASWGSGCGSGCSSGACCWLAHRSDVQQTCLTWVASDRVSVCWRRCGHHLVCLIEDCWARLSVLEDETTSTMLEVIVFRRAPHKVYELIGALWLRVLKVDRLLLRFEPLLKLGAHTEVMIVVSNWARWELIAIFALWRMMWLIGVNTLPLLIEAFIVLRGDIDEILLGIYAWFCQFASLPSMLLGKRSTDIILLEKKLGLSLHSRLVQRNTKLRLLGA